VAHHRERLRRGERLVDLGRTVFHAVAEAGGRLLGRLQFQRLVPQERDPGRAVWGPMESGRVKSRSKSTMPATTGSGEPGDARSRLLDLVGVGLGRNVSRAGTSRRPASTKSTLGARPAAAAGKGHLAGVHALDDPDPADVRHSAERLVDLIRTSTRVVSCDGSSCSPGVGTLSIEITDWSTSSCSREGCVCRV
jgi:hypothetical protein